MMGTETYERESQFDDLPEGLKPYPNFLLWKSSQQPKPNGKFDKIPFSPRTKREAKVNNPFSADCFAKALTVYLKGGFSGIGFLFTEHDPFTGVDLDDCIEPETGRIEPWAAEIIRALDSYAEITPSGRGVHVIIKGELPPWPSEKRQNRDVRPGPLLYDDWQPPSWYTHHD